MVQVNSEFPERQNTLLAASTFPCYFLFCEGLQLSCVIFGVIGIAVQLEQVEQGVSEVLKDILTTSSQGP